MLFDIHEYIRHSLYQNIFLRNEKFLPGFENSCKTARFMRFFLLLKIEKIKRVMNLHVPPTGIKSIGKKVVSLESSERPISNVL